MSKQFYFWLGAGLMFLPYIVWALMGQDSFVMIHDNLDGEFVYLKHLLACSDPLGLNPGSVVDTVMTGIPRSCFRSGLNVTVLLFAIFPPFVAYLVNHALVHLVGYVGMHLLLKRYVVPQNDLLVLLFSLGFGLLGYFHLSYGISIAGQPLLLFAMLNLLHGRGRWTDWVVLAVFPFFSFLLVTLPYFLPVLLGVGVWHYWQTRVFPRAFAMGMVLLTVLNIGAEFPLIYSTLIDSGFVSHRIEWQMFDTHSADSVTEFINRVVANITDKQYHPGVFWRWPVMVAFVLCLVFFRKKITRTAWVLVGLLLFITLWVALNDWLVNWVAPHFELFKTLNTKRFFYIAPTVWWLLGALLLAGFDWSHRLWRAGAVGLAGCLLVGVVLSNDEITQNARLMAHRNTWPTYRQFFAKSLFDQIKSHPEIDTSTRFVAVGLHPSILQFNGLTTLDGYQNNYPLAYKHRFRQIIAPELDKNPALAAYFDNFGSRCYTFSAELGKRVGLPEHHNRPIQHLELNTAPIREMGGRYLISAHIIQSARESGWPLIASFESQNEYWTMHVYDLLPQQSTPQP